MANKNILTNAAKQFNVQEVYYSPVAVIPPQIDIPLASIYCFLAKVDAWPDENNPTTPTQDQKSLKRIFKNMFVAKQITSSDISPVIERVNWTSGVTYDYYRDDINMFEQDNNGNNVYKYYVKNHYDQVFKCLWNNKDQPATDEPIFQPGSYNTNNIYSGTDGYKWKYIYTVDIGSKVKFMDATWMPVPVGYNTPNPLQTSAGAGSIDVINVYENGSDYNSGIPITITITGDGTGCVAVANVSGNSIADIIVTAPGSNYTYANVTISSASGNGAIAYANTVSPIGGHGFDSISELGCSHVMFTSEFNGDENGVIPTDIDFHQVGLVLNPTSLQTFPNPANSSIYRTTTDLVVAPGFGAYVPDAIVYQGTSLETATFIGTCLSFNTSTNVVKVLNITGTPTTNAPLFGNTSKTVRTLLSVSPPNFTILSGYIAFIENRTGVQRSADGIEQFKFVLGY
jgi:hypothetical protein